MSPDVLAGRIADLQSLAASAGRDPIPVSLFGSRPDATSVARFEAAGVERVTFWVPSEGRDVVLPLVDRYAALITG